MELRPGSTFSAKGADEMILRVMNDIPNRLEVQHYYRGDSVFCNEDCLRAAQSKGPKGTVTAHGNTGWESKIKDVTNWQPKRPEAHKFFEKNGYRGELKRGFVNYINR